MTPAVKAAEQIGYPGGAEALLGDHHPQDRCGRRAVEPGATPRRWSRRSRRSRQSVTEKVGAQHFQGVTVQPMIKLKDGYELIIGSSLDPQFGPVLLFGTGGQLVEVFKDRALALPPLNTTLARRMMEQTKIYKALKGVRGRKPVDLAALEELLVRFSQLVVGAALDQGNRHQPAAGLAGAACSRSTPAWWCTARRCSRTRSAEAGHPAVSHHATWRRGP